MSLIPWKPLDDFFSEDDWLMPVFHGNRSEMKMDIYETDKDVVAEINLPGIDPEKVEIEVKSGILKVKGINEEKKEEKKKDYWRKEIRKGSFERMIKLPALVKEEEIDASYQKGVLKIVMPKEEESKEIEKKIKIKVKE